MGLGNFLTSTVRIDKAFTTVNGTGDTTALTAGSIGVYRQDLTTFAGSGFVLTASLGSRTGLNHVVIFPGSQGAYYTAGDFQIVLMAGSVGTINMANQVIDTFSLGRPLDVTSINSVSTSSVTAINANQGTTQPINYTGTGASALVKSDVVDIAGVIVASSGAQLGVNVVQIGGVVIGTSGAITFPAGTLASTTNLTAGTVTTATNVTNAPTAGDFTATMKGSITTALAAGTVGSVTGAVGSVTGAVGSVTGNVGGNVTGSVGSVVGLTASNLDATVSSRATPAQVTAVLLAGTVGAVTGLTAANLDATISSRATPVQVNAEVLDVLNVDTFAQPGQATPAATTTIRLMLAWVYKAWRNRTTQTAVEYDLFNDDAVTVDQKATFSDNGTTADRTEIITGP